MTAPGSELVFLPLGGVGEIGMNLGLYGVGPPHARKWLMVDCGVTFAEGRWFPGVDLILPDISFIEEERRDLVGIVITHAHEDHYGALLDLWPRLQAPVYATQFTTGLLRAKAIENGKLVTPDVNVVTQGETLQIGPFSVEFVPVSHSIPEPNALAIRTDHGLIVHTGDWKIDPEPGVGIPIGVERLKELGEEGVIALMCDSTNAQRPGRSPSEHDVAEGLKSFIASAPHRVAVTAFSSNVARIRAVCEAAAATDRHVVVMGRAMRRVIEVATECGFMDGLPKFLSEDDVGHLPRDKVLVLLTGSQGEERAALARIASDNHPRVALSAGDRVIFSSRTIPGNEKAVNEVMNGLALQGIEVVTDSQGLVHTSGHPRRDELVELYGWLKPKVLIPVHGEPVHLAAHERLAKANGIDNVVMISNGKMARLDPAPAAVVDEIEPNILLMDGRLLRTPEEANVRERRALAFAGVVTAVVTLDDRYELDDDPLVVLMGIPARDDEGETFREQLVDEIAGAVESIPRHRRRDRDTVVQAARRAIRSHMSQHWGKKPLCHVFVVSAP
ncbi:MBL fold metallo-hydrolase [Acuticoccus sediminis]|uniref:MBL fold metallo-hydrolase n=1 Tax=Acuticoccus sediminis TaxID=2184697 RepID=A0A8B2NQS1_9HYPH|nr:ribonuclease J [Acuticoccus sediminis]RAI00670.1 MBL fold metallo-hydrolase [Acuticoccus sediminis]